MRESIFSEDVKKGKVITSDPSGGGRVPIAGTVGLIISKGKERIKVPDLSGLSIDDANIKLEASFLKSGRVIERFDAEIEAGFVIQTNPTIDTRVRKESTVDLVVSRGVEQVDITDYKGRSSDQALNELTEAGLNVEPTYEFSDTV